MSIIKAYVLPHAPVLIESSIHDKAQDLYKTRHVLRGISQEIESLDPDTVVIISSNGPIFTDAISVYDFSHYHGGLYEKDDALLTTLMDLSESAGKRFHALNEEGFASFSYKASLDVGILVPANYAYLLKKDMKMLAMSHGSLGVKELIESGQLIHRASERLGRKTVVIASGSVFDNVLVEGLSKGALFDVFLNTFASRDTSRRCLLKPYAMLLGTLLESDINIDALTYEQVFNVGYVTTGFSLEGKLNVKAQYLNFLNAQLQQKTLLREGEHPYVKVARAAISHWLCHETEPELRYDEHFIYVDKCVICHELPTEDFLKSKGIFVTINDEAGLRGCMGSTTPVHQNVFREIMRCAIASAFHDPKMQGKTALKPSELSITIDVLSKPESIKDIAQLDPSMYGVIVMSESSMGIILPNIEGVYDVNEQLNIACHKGGFTVDKCERMMRFTVDRYT